MDEKLSWDEYGKRYKETTEMIKKMPVDELLEKLGYPMTTPNRLFEEGAEVENPLLDKMIFENHLKGVEV